MGSATASPERGDKEGLPGSEAHGSKLSRSTQEADESQSHDHSESVAAQDNDRPDSEDSAQVVRKGRGSFRGLQEESEDASFRAARGRDFDATVLRQYPTKEDKLSKKKGRSSKEKRSSLGEPVSDGEDTESDHIDDVAKLALSLEASSLSGETHLEKRATTKDDEHAHEDIPVSSLQGDQNVAEDWEKIADAAVNDDSKAKADNKPDQNQKPFKKGHKKSKSSKIEFNFDPDAYDGSTRILDVCEFPASFKTHHLHEIFQEYEAMRGGYRIKWMDDTRALIIFEHPATARKAYLDNVANPLAKVRPYEGPTDFLQKNPSAAPRPRPATTDMVAKRLVHGALGVRVARSPEQRQAERQLIQNARDQREAKRAETISRSQDLDAAFDE